MQSTETAREYRTDDLIVYWFPKQCSHASKCWQGLPQVFKPEIRPWIDLHGASPEEIIKIIDTCPTDALKYSLPESSKVNPELAKGPGSVDYKAEPKPNIQIRMVKSGPLLVKGRAQIFDHDGKLIMESNHVVLCACGRSGNIPFCDGSHNQRLQTVD